MILMFQLVYAPVNLPFRVEVSLFKKNEMTHAFTPPCYPSP